MINTTIILEFVLEVEPLSSKDNTHSHTPNYREITDQSMS